MTQSYFILRLVGVIDRDGIKTKERSTNANTTILKHQPDFAALGVALLAAGPPAAADPSSDCIVRIFNSSKCRALINKHLSIMCHVYLF